MSVSWGAIGLALSAQAYVMCPATPPPSEVLKAGGVIFIGEPIRFEPAGRSVGSDGQSWETTLVSFRIERYWSRDPVSEVFNVLEKIPADTPPGGAYRKLGGCHGKSSYCPAGPGLVGDYSRFASGESYAVTALKSADGYSAHIEVCEPSNRVLKSPSDETNFGKQLTAAGLGPGVAPNDSKTR